MSEETKFEFGDRVIINGIIRKVKVSRRTKWNRYSLGRVVVTTGIVIGKRTLREGTSEFAEYGSHFCPEGDPISAYLVAYDMRRKPVFCLPDQIVRAESESK